MIGTALAAFVQVGVKQLIFNNVPDICTRDQRFSLTCPHNQVFFTASAVWYVSYIFCQKSMRLIILPTKGTDRPRTPVRHRIALSPTLICDNRWCVSSDTILPLPAPSPPSSSSIIPSILFFFHFFNLIIIVITTIIQHVIRVHSLSLDLSHLNTCHPQW